MAAPAPLSDTSPERSGALRVLAVSHPSGMYGAQRRLLVLAPALAERDVRVTLAADDSGRWPEQWAAAGLATERLALPRHGGLRAEDGASRPPARQVLREAGVVVESARRIARLARRHDVLFSASLSAHPEVALAGRLARRPVVLLLVDIVVPGIGRRLLQRAASSAAAVVANSHATASALEGTGNVHVIHPGLDVERFHPGPKDGAVRADLGATDGDLLVGIVGRLAEDKGIHVLIDAVAGLGAMARPVKLAIVGDSGVGPTDHADRLRAQAATLGDRVRFVGRRDDMEAVVRSLDVLVNASRAEPFGMSVLEAQASGVAVVASAGGGIPEFVVDGETGVLVPPFDAPALRDALARVLGDDALRARLGANARAHVEREHDVRAQFDRYAALFREVAR